MNDDACTTGESKILLQRDYSTPMPKTQWNFARFLPGISKILKIFLPNFRKVVDFFAGGGYNKFAFYFGFIKTKKRGVGQIFARRGRDRFEYRINPYDDTARRPRGASRLSHFRTDRRRRRRFRRGAVYRYA